MSGGGGGGSVNRVCRDDSGVASSPEGAGVVMMRVARAPHALQPQRRGSGGRKWAVGHSHTSKSVPSATHTRASQRLLRALLNAASAARARRAVSHEVRCVRRFTCACPARIVRCGAEAPATRRAAGVEGKALIAPAPAGKEFIRVIEQTQPELSDKVSLQL